MRMFRLCWCVATVSLISIPSVGLLADDGVHEPEVSWLDDVTVDPDDAGLIELRGDEGSCEPIGAFIQNFGFRDFVFRGNMFDIDHHAVVTEFGFELEVSANVEVDLYFYVFEETDEGRPSFQLSPSQARQYIVPVLGDGQRRVYTTYDALDLPGNEIHIPLTPGKAYVFGVAWGEGATKYARDPSQAPNMRFANFPNGIFRGSVSEPLDNQTEPPMEGDTGATRDLFVTTSGGPWSMTICLAGACCRSGFPCSNQSVRACLSDGGEFTAPGLACEEIGGQLACPLPVGACCIEDDPEQGCLVNVNQYNCEFEGGSWFEGELCQQTFPPCEPRGGCCLPPGVDDPDEGGIDDRCTDNVTRARCIASESAGGFGGQWRGEEVACDEFPPCTAGACCTGDFCNFELTAEGCLENEGLFAGFGTNCDDDPCAARGACCHDPDPSNPNGPTECLDHMTEAECTAMGYVYHGDWSACAEVNCKQRGACCRPGRGCSDGGGLGLSAAQCGALNGNYRGDGSTCAGLADPCPGLCCEGQFCNEEMDLEFCQLLSGTFVGYDVDGCPNDDEDPDPCEGLVTKACCLVDGSCIETTVEACGEIGGAAQAEATCAAATCVQPDEVVPCCLPGGNCVEVVASVCTIQLGGLVPLGETSCTAGLCAASACCLPSGDCDLTDAVSCDDMGGTYEVGFSCRAGSCPQAGACCLPDGSCAENETELDCFHTLGGIYRGDDAVCATAECPGEEACCIGTVCAPQTGFACDANGGTPLPGEDDCDTDSGFNLCVPGACCQRDGTCTDGVLPLDCEDTGGVFQGGGAICAFVADSCPKAGACCFPPVAPGEFSTCELLTEAICLAEGGTYAGDDVECKQTSEGACLFGACCLGTIDWCTDELYQFECVALGGETFVNYTCEAIEADCRPFGACCNGTTCTMTSEQLCEDGGGVYSADRQTCNADSCESGACCMLSGICNDSDEGMLGATCDALDGDFYLGDLCEAVSVCELRGACCHADGTCSIEVGPDCTAGGGEYAGNGVPCTDDLCALGACCLDTEACVSVREAACTALGGDFEGIDTSCSPSPCTSGACCHDGTCSVLSPAECAMVSGEYQGNDAPCTPADLCIPKGACCLPDASCVITSELGCLGQNGIFKGEDTDCSPTPCEDVGACCLGEACSVITLSECTSVTGTYLGNGTDCIPNPCEAAIEIVSSNPPSGSIDARHTSAPNGSSPAGWDAVMLTFDGPTDSLVAGDFAVTSTSGTTPTITGLIPAGSDVTLQFDGFIPTEEWTQIEHLDSGTRVCLAYMPADVNGDRTAAPADILAVIDQINGVTVPPLELWQADTDRDGTVAPADILRVIDLLNGAGVYESWLNRSIGPSPCDTP